MNCGYGEKIILYAYGEAGAALGAEVEGHLAACPACRSELAALRAADAGLAARVEEPAAAAVANVMRAARAAVASRRGFSFNWGEALLSGALASALAFVFAFSGRSVSAELAWNSGLDAGLDSVEYSFYQAQSDLNAPSGDWDYEYSSLEDENLNAGENA
jgi:anti-sigma factor RsiW